MSTAIADRVEETGHKERAGRQVSPWLVTLGLRLLVLAIFVACWEGAVALGVATEFWISRPTLVGQRFAEYLFTERFYQDVFTTLYEMALGLGAGVVFGVISGLALTKWPLLHRATDPYIMIVYSLPRIALAPLFILWLGLGLASKVVLALFVAYFVMLINTYAGIRNVDQDLLNAVRTMGASDSFLTRKVRLPAALPWIFSGIRIALGASLVGAVVAEMLGSTHGIGHEIARAAGAFDTTGIFTYLLVLAVVATGLNEGMKWAERRLLTWQVEQTV